MSACSQSPAPLVSVEVDLRDFSFMPLDVVRLRDSGLTAKATGDEFRAAVLLWCASWHQRPAASLPNDDMELANLCGYGRSMREWSKIRKGALRGWVECADGRLYHPLIAVKANEAWQSKLAQRARTEAARKAREEARQKQSQSVLQSLSQTSAASVTEAVTATVTESKGQGQGQGQGIEENKAATPPPARKRAKPALVAAEALVADGVEQQHADDWLAIRKAKALPLTRTAWDETKAEAAKAGIPVGQAVKAAAAHGWGGFRAAWASRIDAPINGAGSSGHATGGTPAEPAWRREQRERMAAFAGPYAAKPAVVSVTETATEVIDATPRLVG